MVATLAGAQFGDWVLLSKEPGNRFKCRCICGVEKTIPLWNLRSGRSCGCGCVGWKISAKVALKHGATVGGGKTREFRAWSDMRTRCTNPNRSGAKYYFGKGIGICPEWASFEAFLADMGPCPKGLTLDRIDGAKGYSKENCRWAARTVQSYNATKAPGASGERGVALRGGKAQARIQHECQRIHLGTFASVEEAASVRRQAEIATFGFEAPR